MDGELVTFLNKFPLGTTLVIIIGLGALAMSGYSLFKKYKENLKKQILADEENTSYKKSIDELKTGINGLETSIANYVELYDNERRIINEKLDRLSEKIEEEHTISIESDKKLEEYIQDNAGKVNDLTTKMDIINKKTNLLIDSDKEGIKATITDKYYQAMREKYIEIHVLQSLESLYEKYLEEHGNTFIGGLMKDLRMLPHTPPEDNE
jgi:hypothetical protein